jgi:peroxiredoxin Q/BCP
VGISPDPVETQLRFRDSLGLPFHFISDVDKQIIRQYDVQRRFRMGTSRVTYVVDMEGTIRGVHHNEVSMGSHVREVSALVQDIQYRAQHNE